MSDFLDQVEAAAATRTLGSAPADELQANATLAKTIAEAQKARADAQNQLKQLHLERLKSWSTLLVPIVSLLTLLATVIVQSFQLHQQLQATARQSEDSEWRELISSLRGPPKSYASDITVSSRLKTFLNSDRYAEQARYLAIRLMGNLTNVGTFNELFNAAVPVGKNDALKIALDIARALTATRRSLETDCHEEAVALSAPSELYYGVCQTILSDVEVANLAKTAKDPNALLQLRRSYLGVLDELLFVGEFVGATLRKDYATNSKERKADPVDLSYLNLQNTDLSGVDFSSFDMINTVLDFANLDGAVLTPRKTSGLELLDSSWWDAKAIDQSLLRFLVDNRFPYYTNLIQNYPRGEVTREYYEARIKALCVPAQKFCEPPLKYKDREEPPHFSAAPREP